MGLLVVIIAHCDPPPLLFQLRNFGTPVLIVASALTYAVIYERRVLETKPFLKKRVSRLIFPTWLFLTFFFIATFFGYKLASRTYPFDLGIMIETYTLHSGLGFVWIFKVYLILALITPGALKLSKAIKSHWVYFGGIAAAYCAYEFMVWSLTPIIPEQLTVFMKAVVFLLPPYSLLYLYGLKLRELSERQILVAALGFLALFLCIATYLRVSGGTWVPTEEYKYPPTIYYLSYAMFAAHVLYVMCRRIAPHISSRALRWLSMHSLWVYLWHIFALYAVRFLLGPTKSSILMSTFKVAAVLGIGALFTHIQTSLAQRYLVGSPRNVDRTLARLLV